MKSIRSILYILLSAGSFFLVTYLVKPIVPWPDDGGLRAKYEYFKAHKDEYNGLFFGSSKVFRAIDPVLVQEELGRHGRDVHAFNFGCPSMYTFETDFVLKEVLRLDPKGLETVFLEWVNWNPKIQEDDLYTVRSVHWHSTEETLLALDAVFSSKKPVAIQLGMAIDHVAHWVWKQVSYGRGLDTMSALMGWLPQKGDTSFLHVRHGYRALEDELALPGIEKRRNYFVKNQHRYQEMLRSQRQRNRRTGAAAGIHEKSLSRQIEAIRIAGAKPLFMDIPGELETPALIPLVKDQGIPTLLGYNRLRVFPQFFLPDNRFDANHFSREGARLFSKQLSDDLAGLLENGGDE